jgi:hypothetical protein
MSKEKKFTCSDCGHQFNEDAMCPVCHSLMKSSTPVSVEQEAEPTPELKEKLEAILKDSIYNTSALTPFALKFTLKLMFQAYQLGQSTHHHADFESFGKALLERVAERAEVDIYDWDRARIDKQSILSVPFDDLIPKQNGDMVSKSDVIEVMKYMCGYTDFPGLQEGQGAFYWRSILREKMREIGVEIPPQK